MGSVLDIVKTCPLTRILRSFLYTHSLQYGLKVVMSYATLFTFKVL